MGELVDPQQASMDGLIDWLRQHRRRDPVSPLSKLLKDKAFDEQRIVDIACIDLMERRRMGHAVAVEDYQKEFICIQEESNLLDLIDAEICVASELGENPQSGNYEQRFPTLAVQIAELLRLDAAAECELRQGMGVGTPAGAFAPHELSASETNADQTNGALRAPSDSADFSIERLPADAAATPTRPREPHPIDLPEWFVGEQCVASSPGRWLIRGRDSVRGVNLALKVTELSPQLTATQGDQILDAAEAAAKVRNPSWVQPSVAAIQNRHLGVIRPWIYARPWLQTRTMENDRDAMRDLAAVAFAVASAHKIGATHGGLHVQNLMVNHEGKVQVLDAASSRSGIQRWLHPSSKHHGGEQIISLEDRIQVDIQDLIRVVAAASVDWNHAGAQDVVADLRRAAAQQAEEACALMGQKLIAYADSNDLVGSQLGRHQQRSWRIRLSRWLNSGN